MFHNWWCTLTFWIWIRSLHLWVRYTCVLAKPQLCMYKHSQANISLLWKDTYKHVSSERLILLTSNGHMTLQQNESSPKLKLQYFNVSIPLICLWYHIITEAWQESHLTSMSVSGSVHLVLTLSVRTFHTLTLTWILDKTVHSMEYNHWSMIGITPHKYKLCLDQCIWYSPYQWGHSRLSPQPESLIKQKIQSEIHLSLIQWNIIAEAWLESCL